MTEITEKKAFDKLAAWCASSEHCVSEAVDKMLRWGIPAESQKRILEMLTQNNFIDEDRFSVAYTTDKFRFQKWGRKKIAEGLRAKKIDRKTVERAIATLCPEEYLELLKKIVKAKNDSLHEPDEYKRKSKLYRYALSRGFEPRLISQLLHFDEIPEMD